MNDQTSPTAGGQRPDPQRRDPFAAPPEARGLPPIPDAGRGGGNGVVHGGPGGPVSPWGAPAPGYPVPAPSPGPTLRERLRAARPDLEVAALLVFLGGVLGVLGGMVWYRFAPTVWLAIPADSVGQVKDGVDQSALLVSPEGKGIASVDGYFFVIVAVVGLLLGTAAFFLGRRGLRVFGGWSAGRKGDRNGDNVEPDGAGVGAWAGVLLGGLLATTVTAALGRWLSLPDPVTLLRQIAAGEKFHATLALHAQGLYLAAPILGMVWFTALTAAFTKPAPPPRWLPYGERQGYFSTDNPYGLPATAPNRGADHDHSGE